MFIYPKSDIIHNFGGIMTYIIYGKPNCPYCIKAISLLWDHGKDFSYMGMSKEFLTSYGFKTYPQIFLQTVEEDIHIGGYQHLQRHLYEQEQ